MKLKIEHLAPYLPYELKYIDKDSKKVEVMRSISTEINLIDMGWGNAHELKEFKPILRPITDISYEEIENLGYRYEVRELDCGEYMIFRDADNSSNPLKWAFEDVQKLFEWNFDVFGLIKKGLAIDVNSIEKISN